jgi:glycosyltransferase involved in cell wall biosynthesis
MWYMRTTTQITLKRSKLLNSEPSRICYMQLMPAYAPSWGFGGPFRLMYDYAQGMKASVSKVAVISGNAHHDYGTINQGLDKQLDMQVIRVNVFGKKLIKRSIWLVSPSMLIRACWVILTFRGIIVLHYCELRGLVPIYATLTKLLFRRKVRLIHSAFGMLHHKESRLREFYDRHVIRHQFNTINIGLAQNTHELRCYEAFAKEYAPKRVLRTELFPLHINQRKNQTPSDGARNDKIRTSYGIAPDCILSIFLGRIHPEKGILRTIDCHREFIQNSGLRAHLLIVGRDDGFQSTMVDYIKAHDINNSVTIVNNIYEERFDYYSSADIFLGLPTIYEETMLASLEALSCGTPIIVSREADIPYIEDANAGFVIDFSIEQVVQCMLKITSDLPNFRRRAVAASRSFANVNAMQQLAHLVRGLGGSP